MACLNGRNSAIIILMLRRKLSAVCAVILTLGCLTARGQSGRWRHPTPRSNDGQNQQPSDVISLEATEVVVPVTVRNRYGRPIPGLTKDDFILYEDGVRQEITGFDTESVPAAIVMLIDVSGSVRTEINNIRLSALTLIDQLRPQDRACIIQFNDRVRVIQDWTSDKLRLQRALMTLPATGATAFYNALYTAAEKLSQVKGRRTIIAFTDGVDTYRGQVPQTRGRREKPMPPKSPAEAFEAVRRAEASVYVISKTRAIRDYLTGRRAPSFLRPIDPRDPYIQYYLQALDRAEQWLAMLAERTGGEIYFPRNQLELKDVYNDIAEELNTQYVLRYVPKNTNFDGRFRRIRVVTGNPAYIARAREGYYAVKR
ncbi:MAG: VWA domain-containing protein [Acidobacteria bacterium]|nr:MAG: VWA domain-containing protein [Acidobacteriota bacterium]